VEGKGFQGALNLLRGPLPFGEFHTLEVQSRAGAGGVALFVDGKPAGRRDRQRGTLQVDDLTVGARFYTNTADPPFLQGFLDGDVAEVLLYDRLLADSERKAVLDYLGRKHAGLTAALAGGRPLVPVADPPPVQMLVPGFTVKQLPVELP